MRRKLFVVVALVTLFVAAPAASFADSHGGGCKKSKGGYGKSKCMVTKMAKMLMRNEAELGLTETQVEKVKAIKTQYKKDAINQGAAIDVVAVDIKSKLYEDVVDTEAVNALIDKKYDLKKAKAKAEARAIAELKALLSEQQMSTMKQISKQCKKGKK